MDGGVAVVVAEEGLLLGAEVSGRDLNGLAVITRDVRRRAGKTFLVRLLPPPTRIAGRNSATTFTLRYSWGKVPDALARCRAWSSRYPGECATYTLLG